MNGQILINKLLKVAIVAGVTLGLGFNSGALAQTAPYCGPMDLVFVVDDTGSMWGAIDNVKAGISSIANDVVSASGGDYQMGLVSFKDNVETDVDLATGNEAAVQAGILNLYASYGAGGPEASDAALDTIVNGTSAGSDGGPCNASFNNTGFRESAVKIAVLLTDNLPGGCNDGYTTADGANAARVANDASAAGIKISAIYNSDYVSPYVVGIMTNYAATTGGVYVNTPGNGSGSASAIEDIIASCGSSANKCPLSQGFWKNHTEDWPVTNLTIGGIFYTADQLLMIFQTAPKKGNSYLILGHQVIAALLNIANGSDPSVIGDTLASAEAALTGVNLLTDYTKDDGLNDAADLLDDYNTRDLTPTCEEPGNS